MNSVPSLPQIHIHLELQNMTSFGNRIFAEVIKMRSYWIKMGPKSSDWDPDKKRRGCTKTQRQGHKEMEAEIAVTFLQAEGCPGLPPKARQRSDSPSEPPGDRKSVV